MVSRFVLLVPFVLGSLCACSGREPVATIPASGVTASNGGGQRAIGGLPDVSVTNGRSSEVPYSRNNASPDD